MCQYKWVRQKITEFIWRSLCKLLSSLPLVRVEPRAGPARFGIFSRESGESVESMESADEFREAIFCAQAHAGLGPWARAHWFL